MPPFKAELKKIADLLHYTVDYTSIDQEQLSNILLYKWYQYSYQSHHFIEPILPETATHMRQNPRKLPDEKEEKRLMPTKNILLSMMTTFTARGHAMFSSPISSSQEDVIKIQKSLLSPQARLFQPVTQHNSSQSDIPKKPNQEKSNKLPERHLKNTKKF